MDPEVAQSDLTLVGQPEDPMSLQSDLTLLDVDSGGGPGPGPSGGRRRPVIVACGD